MVKLQRIKDILRQQKQELKNKFKLKRIGIFGPILGKNQIGRAILIYLWNLKKCPIF